VQANKQIQKSTFLLQFVVIPVVPTLVQPEPSRNLRLLYLAMFASLLVPKSTTARKFALFTANPDSGSVIAPASCSAEAAARAALCASAAALIFCLANPDTRLDHAPRPTAVKCIPSLLAPEF
jgi:hypothetical protein